MFYMLKLFIQILILMYQNKKNILLLNMKLKKCMPRCMLSFKKVKNLIYFEIMKNRE